MKYDQVEKLGHLSGKYKLSNDEMSKYKTSLTQVIIILKMTMMNWTMMMVNSISISISISIPALPSDEDGVQQQSKQPKLQVSFVIENMFQLAKIHFSSSKYFYPPFTSKGEKHIFWVTLDASTQN